MMRLSTDANYSGGSGDELGHVIKDDMASRRISTHIPAPLRKKKNEEQYKKFITPTGNPVAYLQQHMRSKSMSDLNEEKKEEEAHRHQINERYGEMEKLKVLLKEEEDTWTSKLQSWKSRRRSVTEDARKRKEERDSIEKELEHKAAKKKTKTYKEIVEDKMKRDKELAQLNDHDEYEFVSPRSSTVTSPTNSRNYTFEGLVRDVQIREKENKTAATKPSNVYSSREEAPKTNGSQVQYKYTTKVTAVINNTQAENKHASYEAQPQMRSTITYERVPNKSQDNSDVRSTSLSYTPSKSQTLPRGGIYNSYDPSDSGPVQRGPKPPQRSSYEMTPQSKPVQRETRSNVPSVLMRTKNPNARKERPKSAHELPTGSSSTLPRNYHEYSAPKPFTPGASSFTKYRKTNFANRRSMWENMSKPETDEPPSSAAEKFQPAHGRSSSSELLITRRSQDQSVTSEYAAPKQNQTNKDSNLNRKHINPEIYQKFTSSVSAPTNTGKTAHPAKVPLVSKAQFTSSTRKFTKSASLDLSEQEGSQTATLSLSGLSMTSPRVNKAATLPVPTRQPEERDHLFDDMKICINQRPRSEKGFGFTVRGGDDGKPVIVDTVSPGGAADICHLCVSDEILAINEVPLADCKTQDDIVQLIVSSVITGNLSLNIRRYGKAKKASPLRLAGTKVVMTAGGFVQVRSDKPITRTNEPDRTSYNIARPKEISVSSPVHTDDNNNDMIDGDDELPPPPTQQELEAAHYSIVAQTNNRRLSPLSGLVAAASQNSHHRYNDANSDSFEQASSFDSYRDTALSEVHSDGDDIEGEEELRQQVLEAQKELDFEQVDQYDIRRREDENLLRLELQEEQRKLEMEEAQREEIRRKMQEEAKLEDLRVEEELRKIQARRMKQQEQRRNNMQSYQDRPSGTQSSLPTAPPQASRTNGLGMMGILGGGQHWMVEEAERRRVAEKEGKPRANALHYGKKSDSRSGSGLPDHVIQRLTNRAAAKSTGPRPFVKEQFWNDPNAKATLL
ncbi:uncharacterized protein LOC120329459 [Styela clava]